MADHRADPAQVISPKVIVQAATSLGLVAVIAAIGAITPELFEGMGPWGLVAYAAVVAVGGALAGYAKNDPLRRSEAGRIDPGASPGPLSLPED